MKKILISALLAIMVLTMSFGTVFAQSTTITGDVQSVTLGTDANGATIVTVTLLDSQGVTQTVTLSLETATTLGLVTTDPATGVTTISDTAVGTSVTIDSADVLPTPTTEESQHPVASKLSEFFSSLLGVDYDTLMSYHDDGVGFGVIAQALWITNELGGSTDTFSALLEAKQSGDYSNITLADGSTPRNWGDVVKSIKHGDNLGKVMSGHTDSTDSTSTQNEHGKPDNGHGKPDNEHGKPDNGHGKP